MKIRTILLAGGLITLGACSESEYELQNLVPEEYHKILYINNSGKQEVTLYDTELDNTYALSVFKAGSDPNLTASVSIGVLTQAEVDSKYSTPEGIDYRVIAADCYSLDAATLDFASTDRYKMVNISLTPQRVKALIETEPAATWVLPLHLVSQSDSINAEKDELFLKIAGVITPAVGFNTASAELNTYNYGSASTFAVSMPLTLDVNNIWDLECSLAIDPDYVAAYNEANATAYVLLPADTYTVPETATLARGTTILNVEVSVEGAQLPPGDYMLPVRITGISQFEISSTNAVYPLRVRILGQKFDRIGWTAEATSEEHSGEGSNGRVTCALDGDINSYWHSAWQSGIWGSLPYQITVDTQAERTFSHFGLQQRQNESFRDVASGHFEVSLDGISWTNAGNFSMQQIFEEQVFGITPVRGRYFRVVVEQSYRDTNASFAEICAYGIE